MAQSTNISIALTAIREEWRKHTGDLFPRKFFEIHEIIYRPVKILSGLNIPVKILSGLDMTVKYIFTVKNSPYVWVFEKLSSNAAAKIVKSDKTYLEWCIERERGY